MRFLADAQLPKRMFGWLRESGHDAIHTLDLPAGNATTDAETIARAVAELRIVVTKDDDFVQSFMVHGRPPKSWLISTGNISKSNLERLIRANFHAIAQAFEAACFIELAESSLVVHE